MRYAVMILLVLVLAGCSGATRTTMAPPPPADEAGDVPAPAPAMIQVPQPAALPAPAVPSEPTDAERKACERDVEKFCKKALPQAMAVALCLRDNRKKISKACQQVMVARGM